MAYYFNEENYFSSNVVDETSKEKITIEKENVEKLDLQEGFLASGGAEFSKEGASGTKAKGRGAR